MKFLEDEFKAEVVSINIPELEVCPHARVYVVRGSQGEVSFSLRSGNAKECL